MIDTALQKLPSNSPQASIIAEQFKELLSQFGHCHRIYNQSLLEEDQIYELGIVQQLLNKFHASYIPLLSTGPAIVQFMNFFRTTFPSATVPVKMHLLEDHAEEWIRAHGVGFGMMGEQGAESIHARFNGLLRTYATIRNNVKKLEYIMKEHLTSIAPQNVEAMLTILHQ